MGDGESGGKGKKTGMSFPKRFFLEMSQVNFRAALGFSFCQVWFTICFFDPGVFPDDLAIGIYEMSLTVCALSLVPCLLRAQRFEVLFRRESLAYLLAACASCGVFVVALLIQLGVPSLAQQVIAGVLIGFPAGWFFVMWYQKFAVEKDYNGLIASIVLSSTFMYVLSIVSELLSVGPWVMVIAAGLAPLLAAVLFARSAPERDVMTHYHFPKRKTNQYRVLVLLCCGIFAIILAHGFMRKYYFSSLDVSFHTGSLNFLLLIAKTVCFAMVVAHLSATEHRVSIMYRVVCILTIVGVLLMPYAKSIYYFLYGIIDFGAFVLNLMTLLLAYAFFHRYRVSSVLVFALIRIVYCAALFAGVLLSRVYRQMLPLVPDLLGIVSISLGLLVFAICLYIFTEKGSTPFLPKEESSRTSSLEEACVHLVRLGNLSKRESDVLLLVVKGRSTPRIQEEMHLSTNTINTHIQHIYQKLNVHSRQELLDIAEQVKTREPQGEV